MSIMKKLSRLKRVTSRGAQKVSSCLIKNYSGGCWGQKRNIILRLIPGHPIRNIDHLKIDDLNFIITHHSLSASVQNFLTRVKITLVPKHSTIKAARIAKKAQFNGVVSIIQYLEQKVFIKLKLVGRSELKHSFYF